MPNWLRALIAGYGAKKLGGGCFSTILIFILIYWGLGKCNPSAPQVQHGSIKTEQHVKKVAMVQPAATLQAVHSK